MMRAAILARKASTRHYQKYSCFRTYSPRRDIPRHCAAAEDHIWTNYTREFIKIALMVKCLTLKINKGQSIIAVQVVSILKSNSGVRKFDGRQQRKQ
jgi:hypothetical protein